MKLYEKIGIPGPSWATPWVASHGPFIVLTVEEAKELWDAAADHGAECQRKIKEHVRSANFTTYLTSKGINIP